MSTRGCVAVGTVRKWRGVYNHSDSYPGGLGAEVYKLAKEQEELGKLGNFCSYILRHSRWENCHEGPDHPDATHIDQITSSFPDPLHIEWVYVIDERAAALHVLCGKEVRPRGHVFGAHSRPDGPVRVRPGTWDYGHCRYRVAHPCSIPFRTTAEPDWYNISLYKEDPALWDSGRIYLVPPPVPRTAFERVLSDDVV